MIKMDQWLHKVLSNRKIQRADTFAADLVAKNNCPTAISEINSFQYNIYQPVLEYQELHLGPSFTSVYD